MPRVDEIPFTPPPGLAIETVPAGQSLDDMLAAQASAGFPFLQGIEPAIRALNGLWFHAVRRGRPLLTPPPAPASDLSPATLDATLARYGIALPKCEAVASAAEAEVAL